MLASARFAAKCSRVAAPPPNPGVLLLFSSEGDCPRRQAQSSENRPSDGRHRSILRFALAKSQASKLPSATHCLRSRNNRWNQVNQRRSGRRRVRLGSQSDAFGRIPQRPPGGPSKRREGCGRVGGRLSWRRGAVTPTELPVLLGERACSCAHSRGHATCSSRTAHRCCTASLSPVQSLKNDEARANPSERHATRD